jgi:hypothetical protein
MYVRTCVFITNITFRDVRCTEAVADWLQTESYKHRSDYRHNIWSYRNNKNGNIPEVK